MIHSKATFGQKKIHTIAAMLVAALWFGLIYAAPIMLDIKLTPLWVFFGLVPALAGLSVTYLVAPRYWISFVLLVLVAGLFFLLHVHDTDAESGAFLAMLTIRAVLCYSVGSIIFVILARAYRING